MARNDTTDADTNSKKRVVFFQQLSPQTTTASLKQYLSAYRLERCTVPSDSAGKNRQHGIVTFGRKESIDNLMSKRPLRIDGEEVIVHRWVPDQGPLKQNYINRNLVVSSAAHQSLTSADIKSYFADYGHILDIGTVTDDVSTWVVHFDDYDSVDKALQNCPHRIGRTDLKIKKGDRNLSYKLCATSEATPKTKERSPDTEPEPFNKKGIIIDENSVYMSLPGTKYRIHIKNLPSNIEAEALSDRFAWDIYDIVMNSSAIGKSSSTECWLKNANDENEVNAFIQRWNEKNIGGSIIECKKEEDELELCNKFQYGRCTETDERCHWDHIKCTANGKCVSICPYGHPAGMKAERPIVDSVATNYRIKITGFRSVVTPTNLAQLLHVKEKNVYIDRKRDHEGYVVKIKTMKFAKQLMLLWHDKNIDGHTLKCQLESNPMPFARHTGARSQVDPTDGEQGQSKANKAGRTPRYVKSEQDSEEASGFAEIDNTLLPTVDNKELDRDRIFIRKAITGILIPARNLNLRRADSSEGIASQPESKYLLPSDALANEWEVTKKAPHSDGKVLLIRKKLDRQRLAVIKIYNTQHSKDYERELKTLKDLKDVQNVAKLIEPEDASNNNLAQRNGRNGSLWMIMEQARGDSLKEFIEGKHRSILGVSEAIQLVLNLTTILEQIHNKGIFQQNLSPENIMIDWDPKQTSIHQAQLTLLNFSQVDRVSYGSDVVVPSTTHKWYPAAQATIRSLTSTVDASGVCAILFWLLTRMDPRHENSMLPHQLARDKLNETADRTVNWINTDRKISLDAHQVIKYLIDTFDRGFGYPYYYPWMIGDLKSRLESIRELLLPSNPILDTTDTIFQELTSLSNSTPPPAIAIGIDQNAFLKASEAFCQAKQYFLHDGQSPYSWSDGYCTWLNNPHNVINECRHDDVLTYHSFRRNMTTNYSVVITCLASLSEGRDVITLSIGNNVHGKMIRLPIGHYLIAQDYITDVQRNFEIELKNLLLAIAKERKSTQK